MSDKIEIRTGLYYPTQFEVVETRRRGSRISGSVPYNSRGVISNRGRVRKESFAGPGVFDFAIDDPKRDISFLEGHSFDKIIASKLTGTLEFDKRSKSLDFQATLPPESQWTSAMRDVVLNIRSGLFSGVSPGFIIDGVEDAFDLVPEEPGSDILVKIIKRCVLVEVSAVARPVYRESTIDVRQKHHEAVGQSREDMLAWL